MTKQRLGSISINLHIKEPSRQGQCTEQEGQNVVALTAAASTASSIAWPAFDLTVRAVGGHAEEVGTKRAWNNKKPVGFKAVDPDWRNYNRYQDSLIC